MMAGKDGVGQVIIDQMLEVYLHRWTPVKDRGLRGRQYTPSSNSTPPESNKSVLGNEQCAAIVGRELSLGLLAPERSAAKQEPL
jgi:hypothetical protein